MLSIFCFAVNSSRHASANLFKSAFRREGRHRTARRLAVKLTGRTFYSPYLSFGRTIDGRTSTSVVRVLHQFVLKGTDTWIIPRSGARFLIDGAGTSAQITGPLTTEQTDVQTSALPAVSYGFPSKLQ